uniref:Chalcone-flavonone isomerase family protein n=1 Tax=Lindsaea orbiculata TaxID=641184 RepID=A0A4Y6I0P8_9MONI|nr:chalcone isomerase [Lindsaea orbiculata]
MGSECITFEGSSFPTPIASPSSSKTLALVGNGIYDTEIHYLQIKFYAIWAYTEPDVALHLTKWKGKTEDEALAEDSGFFESFCQAPVEKLFKLVIIKEIKGSQFVTPVQSSVRDRLAYADKYEDEEEEALDNLVEFFQKKAWLSQGSIIFLHWHSQKHLEVSVSMEGEAAVPKTFEYTVENENVVRGILEWIIGPCSLSPSLLKSVAEHTLKLL